MLSSFFLNAQEKHGDAFSFFFNAKEKHGDAFSFLFFNAKQNIQQTIHKQICN